MVSKGRKNDMTVKIPKVKIVCTFCGQNFTQKGSLYRHMRNIHKTFAKNGFVRGNLKCPLCKSNNISSYKKLQTHCEVNHNKKLACESFQFSSFNKFLEWKQAFEKDTQSFFMLARTVKVNGKKRQDRYYVCHRSGTYISNLQANERKRRLKQKGSVKINGTCPAHLITSQLKNGEEVKVRLLRTHLGHECEVTKLPLTKPDRDIIAEKLLQGIQSQSILKDIGSKFDSKLRISFITRKDINNIKNSYNVQSDVIFHSEDAKSVNNLIKQLEQSEENPILYYKPYGIEDAEGVIGQNNFFLVFMNKAQQEILNKYGNNILMIDSTHGTNSYKIQLSTLMVLDDAYEGFPVAFLWSRTETETVYQKFFSFLKEKVPDIKPAIFMTNDCNVFYDAFVEVYEHFPKKLLCDWHVKRSLSDNLSKISQVEKRREVMKKLNALINELDETNFLKQLQSILQVLNSDVDTKKYADYFMSNYVNRIEQWAHCFRKGVHQNTNMVLETWHEEIKHNLSVKGKCEERLDVSIKNIIECVRRKFMKRLIFMCRSKVPHILDELRKRHKMTEELFNQKGNIEIIQDMSHSKWLVPSSKNNTKNNALPKYYQVTKNEVLNKNDRCNCSFLCNECCMCLHDMSCTCHDYVIQFNMCKHIHIIGQMLLNNDVVRSDQNWNLDKNGEQSANSTHLFQSSRTNRLEHERNLTVDKINELLQLVNKSTNLDTFAYASKNISFILSGIRALESQTKNSLIAESQDRTPLNIKPKLEVTENEREK